MNSAAKLRNRGIAVIGATALIATSFGPAAMAWNPVTPPPTAANQAGAASWGISDTDRGRVGTQGATAVIAGGQSQDVADIRMVIPATYERGDYIDVALPAVADPASRVLWSATPAVNMSGPYATNTHVGADSQTTGNAGETEETAPLTPFTPAAGQTAPAAPAITPTLITDSNGSRTVRLTINSLADASQANAKFVLTLSGLKVNVGSGVAAGNVVATATAYEANGTASPDVVFFGDGTAAQNETIPAYVSQVGLSANTTSLTSDGTVQTLGPITVAAAGTGAFTTNAPITVTAAGTPLAESPNAQVTFYGANNQQIGSPTAATVTTGDGGTVTANAPAGASRAVFTGVVADTATTPGSLTLNLTQAGGLTTPTSPLTSDNVNQDDITAPTTAEVRVAVNPPVTRLGGADRYETSVKMAEAFAADNPNDEVDNLVIASGQSFPDALSSGYLAATKDAPVVLTQNGQLPTIVREFIREHGVKNVYLVGGEAAINASVEDTLRGTPAFDWNSSNERVAMNTNLQVVRIAGDNRFETNRAVNEYAAARTTSPVGTTVPSYGSAARKTAIVVNGLTPWDALAAGPMVAGSQNPAAGAGNLPIILTAGNSLYSTTTAQFQTLDIGHAIFVGGYGVLPQSLEREAADYRTTAGRLGGGNRWQTAEAVANFLLRPGAVTATGPNPGFEFAGPDGGITQKSPLLTNGGVPSSNAWADALAAGPLAAQNVTVLALTAATSLPADTRDMLTSNRARLSPVTALGLGNVVSTEVVGQANQAVAD